MQYWIDAADRLVEVDDEWRAFAIGNGAPELASDSILGRPIALSCSDATTSEIWAHLFTRARAGAAVNVHARCDAPERRRVIELCLSCDDGRTVRIRAEVLSEEERAPVALLDAHRPHSAAVLVCCSWCKRWRTPSDAWVEVEELVAILRLMEHTVLPGVSHGLCGDCRAAFRQETQQLSGP